MESVTSSLHGEVALSSIRESTTNKIYNNVMFHKCYKKTLGPDNNSILHQCNIKIYYAFSLLNTSIIKKILNKKMYKHLLPDEKPLVENLYP